MGLQAERIRQSTGRHCGAMRRWHVARVVCKLRNITLPSRPMSLCAHLVSAAGALFFYLREQLGEFAARMRSMRLEFRLTAQPAQGLADCLKAQVRCWVCTRLGALWRHAALVEALVQQLLAPCR